MHQVIKDILTADVEQTACLQLEVNLFKLFS